MSGFAPTEKPSLTDSAVASPVQSADYVNQSRIQEMLAKYSSLSQSPAAATVPNESSLPAPIVVYTQDEEHMSRNPAMSTDGSRPVDDESIGVPYDPNLICLMCRKIFRIGEIQLFRRHISYCVGTEV